MADFDPAAPASYQFWTRPVLRFGDLDTVGHVNNVASIAMIEDCRVRFYRAATENAGDDDPLPGGSWVARKLEVDFIAEILWPGADLAGGTAATRFGIGTFVYTRRRQYLGDFASRSVRRRRLRHHRDHHRRALRHRRARRGANFAEPQSGDGGADRTGLSGRVRRLAAT